MKVSLSHESTLWCDPPPVISGEGFIPVTEVRLRTTCRDGAGRHWQSQNGYLVSAQTSFSTETTAGAGDDYYGIAAEGPLYSMRCLEDEPHEFVLPKDGRIHLTFQLFDGNREVWSGETTRVTSGAETGHGPLLWFLHNGETSVEHGVSMLRARGFRVNERHVKSDAPDLDPLLSEMQVGDEPFSLVCSGRSSEAGMELAQRLPGLRNVICFAGSGLRFSPWKIQGEVLPHVVCDHSTLQPRGDNFLTTRKVYAEAVADRENRDRGRIAVEKIQCPLYLFSGSDDQIWPSAAFSELVAQRRKLHGRESDTAHQTFPRVGYDLGPALGLPGLPTTERTISHSSTGFRLLLGGRMARQSRARRECWERLISILE
ncbi:MAG: acyl-CoA thioester hydrolase/BAAT C-terminal domain-containing protein [Vulcanimicrobiota bacterium]